MRTRYRTAPWRTGAALQGTAAGFTLLELLASSAIFAIIMVAIYMMYESNQRIFLTGDARATAQQNARIALEDITATIRMAGSFHPDPMCRPAGSGEAVRIATADTLSLHAGYRDPDPDAGPNQDCNVYVTYSLWDSAGVRGTTLRKETRCDPWGGPCQLGTQNPPLAENVTALAFAYFDANGLSVPLPFPSPTTTTCPSEFPWARPRSNYALDGQGPVSGGTTPSTVTLGSQRDVVRTIRVQVTVETNISYDASSGCVRKDVGGPTQAFTLVSEAQVRSMTP